MGIVVTVFMLLILLLSVPNPIAKRLTRFEGAILFVAFLLGIWNAFWYGAQHFEEFWGMAALISGITMMITSLSSMPLDNSPNYISMSLGWAQSKVNALPQGCKELMLLMLLGCAGIYTYTLVTLNLS